MSERALVTLFGVAVAHDAPPADVLAVTTYSRLRELVLADGVQDEEALADMRTVSMDAAEWDLARGITARLAWSFREFENWRPETTLRVVDLEAFRALLDYDGRHGSRDASLAYRVVAMMPTEGIDQAHFGILREVLAKHAKKEDLLGIIESFARRVIGF